MIGRLNHGGIATPSVEASVALYRDLLGATSIGTPFDLPAQGGGCVSSNWLLEGARPSHYHDM